jgi:hypothetical protein
LIDFTPVEPLMAHEGVLSIYVQEKPSGKENLQAPRYPAICIKYRVDVLLQEVTISFVLILPAVCLTHPKINERILKLSSLLFASRIYILR